MISGFWNPRRVLLVALAVVVLVATLAVLPGLVPWASTTPADPAASSPGAYPNGGGRAGAGGTAGAPAPAASSPPPVTTPPAGYPVRGIDVSFFDHPNGAAIDWTAESAGGARFAYVKATENTDYTNPYFAADLADAKRSGMFAGAYVFGRPDQPNPAAQADFFFQHMNWSRDGLTLPPFVDMEWPWFKGVDDCYNLNQGQMSAWLHAFLDRLQAHIGRRPAIYTAATWWNKCVGGDRSFGRYDLDVSSCKAAPVLPASWSSWTFWQWTIQPCGGPATDQDVFHGSLGELAVLANLPPDRAGAGAEARSRPAGGGS